MSDSAKAATRSTAGGDVAPEIRIDGVPLTLAELACVAGGRFRVRVSDQVWRQVEASHGTVSRIASGNAAAYGINTGFGHLCTTRIPPDQLGRLQTNLVLSHAVGVGEPAPPQIVRWMLLFKIASLCRGASGVSRATVEALAALLEADALPMVPVQGSLGASGDLAPLAHLVLPLLAQGSALMDGHRYSGADLLGRLRLSPLTLGPKEGLALINGTQFMAAYAAQLVLAARRLARYADVIGAMSLEGCAGSVKPFDERLHKLRPHRGAIDAATNIRKLMAESEILASHANCDRVQDPYSLRCIPQVHGAVRDAIEHAAGAVETEINAVTDNPLILENGDVLSGGSFHGEPLALVLDYLAIALSELASISERRTYLLLTGVAGVPALLIPDAGVNSGFMVLQYTAAALVSENKGLCTPASVDSIPTSLGQEDHVSMGARAAVKCMTVLENAERVLAIEQLCAAQAVDFRAPLRPGIGPRAAHEVVRKAVEHASADRNFGEDIHRSLALLRSPQVLEAVESAVGPLL